MDKPHVPTTSEVRDAYQAWSQDVGGDPYLPEQSAAEFDRWLNEVKAQAWDDGFHESFIDANATNPYRKGN